MYHNLKNTVKITAYQVAHQKQMKNTLLFCSSIPKLSVVVEKNTIVLHLKYQSICG